MIVSAQYSYEGFNFLFWDESKMKKNALRSAWLLLHFVVTHRVFFWCNYTALTCTSQIFNRAPVSWLCGLYFQIQITQNIQLKCDSEKHFIEIWKTFILITCRDTVQMAHVMLSTDGLKWIEIIMRNWYLC